MSEDAEQKKRKSKSQAYANSMTKLARTLVSDAMVDGKSTVMVSEKSRATLDALVVALVDRLTEVMVNLVTLSKKKTIKDNEAKAAFDLLLVNSPWLGERVRDYIESSLATFDVAGEDTGEAKKKQHKSNKAGIVLPVNKVNKQIRGRTGGRKDGFYKVSGRTSVVIAAGVEAIIQALLAETITSLAENKKKKITDKFIGSTINEFYYFKDLWPRVVIETTAPVARDLNQE